MSDQKHKNHVADDVSVTFKREVLTNNLNSLLEQRYTKSVHAEIYKLTENSTMLEVVEKELEGFQKAIDALTKRLKELPPEPPSAPVQPSADAPTVPEPASTNGREPIGEASK